MKQSQHGRYQIVLLKGRSPNQIVDTTASKADAMATVLAMGADARAVDLNTGRIYTAKTNRWLKASTHAAASGQTEALLSRSDVADGVSKVAFAIGLEAMVLTAGGAQ